MDVMDKLPTMADDALGNLRTNAERLERVGSAAQRASAASLLPAIKDEQSARKDAKLERQAQARRDAAPAKAAATPRKPRASAKTAKAAEKSA